MRTCRVVTIGGGTGSFNVLSGLRELHKEISTTAVVTSFDDGGSTGRLKDENGALPMGDMRRCLLALSPVQSYWRKIFEYQFNSDDGPLAGHKAGNIIMTAGERLWERQSVDILGKLLQTVGRVIPVSYKHAQLVANLSDGSRIVGESKITTRNRHDMRSIESLEFEGSPQISEEAARAVIEADVIVLCPGSFYTSLMACLITPGMYEALAQSRAQIVWIPNLMNHPAETRNYTLDDFATRLLKVIPRSRLNAVILDDEDEIPGEVLKHYADKEGEMLVASMQTRRECVRKGVPYAYRVVCNDLVSREGLAAGLIRHDGVPLAQCIKGLCVRSARKTFVVGINDVLVQTTGDLKGTERSPKNVFAVAGAAAFLEAVRAYGHTLIVVSRVRKAELVDGEYEKLKVAGLYHLCPEVRIVVGREELVRAVRDMAHAEGERMVLIGDCPQYELVTAAQNGCHTIVRMKLPVRAYFGEDCGRVTYAVTSFEDPRLMDLVTASE